jgi:hypothetical protein
MRKEVIDYNKLILCDINFRTSILESLDWDEDKFDDFFIFLQDRLKTNIAPDTLLAEIKSCYGAPVYKIFFDLFRDMYVKNGLYIKGEDDYEN